MVDQTSLDDLSARPHAVPFPEGEPRVVRLALSAGESVAPHDHPGRNVVLWVRTGHLELRLGEETYPVPAGDLVRFPGDQQIEPRATEDTEAVVVLAERPE